MNSPFSRVRERLHRQEGATLAEYSLILALIVAVAVLAVANLGVPITGFFEGVLPGFG